MVITGLTRNQLNRKVPWVRIPPAPPSVVVNESIGLLTTFTTLHFMRFIELVVLALVFHYVINKSNIILPLF